MARRGRTGAVARRAGVLAAGLLAAPVLAGCGGGDGPTPPDDRVTSVRIDVDPSVQIVNGTPTISVGDSADFDARATGSGGQTVSTTIAWSSLDPSVASVNDTGTAAGLAPGQASIVATAANAVADTAELVVQSGDPDAPNLVAAALDLLPRGVLTSGTVEARAVVENTGQGAGPYELEIRDGGSVLATVQRGGLAAGGSDTVVIDGLGPFAQGTHVFGLSVDSGNEIAEGDETDNGIDARLESWTSGYEIEVRFHGNVSSTLRSEIRDEVDAWETIVTGDVTDVAVDSLMLDDCFGEESPGFGVRTQPIDDLIILVRTDSIDGFGGAIARAGPCFIRSDETEPELPPIPVVGLMEFDEADVDSARAGGFLRPVIRHEAAHVLGFGSLWTFQGGQGDDVGPYQLLDGEDGFDPRFLGAFAIDRYHAIGGADPRVPVEGRPSGPGTRDSHWRESVFDNELMTGFIGAGANPLSEVTIASLADMFYAVDPSRADPYSLPAGGAAAVRLRGRDLGDDGIDHLPLFTLDPSGRVRRVARPAPRPIRKAKGER